MLAGLLESEADVYVTIDADLRDDEFWGSPRRP